MKPGFEKHSGAWYRHADEVIAVSHLQKSQYGPSYYFNQGFWLRQLGSERYPQVNQCHVQSRIEDLLPNAERRTGELLNLDYPMTDADRIHELVAVLEGELRPLIERAGTVQGLRTLQRAGKLAGAGVTGSAQVALNANE